MWPPVAYQADKRADGARQIRRYRDYYMRADDDRTRRTIRVVLDQTHAWMSEGQWLCLEEQDWMKDELRHWNWMKSMFPAFSEGAMESFYYRHGLRFTDDCVRKYIARRDILDIGANQGESMMTLINHTEKRVVSYEIVRGKIPTLRANSERLGRGRSIVVGAGLYETEGEGRTIDGEVARLNLTIGMVKMDVEGVEGSILRGGRKTILRDRPVLSIAIYHNKQFMDLPAWVDELGGYQLRFHFEAVRNQQALCELRLFAVPFEALR
jgi:hypothetical protein